MAHIDLARVTGEEMKSGHRWLKMIKLLARMLRHTFMSKAYCIMRDELDLDENISEVYVVVRIGMPAITVTSLCLKRSNADWFMRYCLSETKGQAEIAGQHERVFFEQFQTLVQTLESSRHLRNYYGLVKDGVRYEVALTNGRGVFRLTLANPRVSDEHYHLVKEIEKTLRSFSK
jgi:hypothetical protein